MPREDETKEYGEIPDSYLDRVDGHWYVIRYGRLPQTHAADCATCADLERELGTIHQRMQYAAGTADRSRYTELKAQARDIRAELQRFRAGA